MKQIFFLVVCLKLLIGRVFSVDENEIIRSLTYDIVDELSENVERNERFVRHVQAVTETAIEHILKNMRTKYALRNFTSQNAKSRAAQVITKKLKKLQKKMKKKKSKNHNQIRNRTSQRTNLRHQNNNLKKTF